MKHLVLAVALLALTAPAFAAKQPTAAQRKTIHEYGNAQLDCLNKNPDDGDRTSKEVVEFCTLAGKLAKKLEDQGFCLYGNSGVGRPRRPWTPQEWAWEHGGVWPKGKRHCYIIPNLYR